MLIGYALCGSYCTFERSLDELRRLVAAGYQIQPIMSENAYTTDTRFGKAGDFESELTRLIAPTSL